MELPNGGVITKTESQSKERLAIFELAHMISVPMSLVAIIKLKVPQTIWQQGTNTPLSASEIIARVRPHGSSAADPHNLQRMLRLLTSYNIFAEHLNENNGERKFSLTDIGKTLVDDDEGLSYAYYMLQHHEDALINTWPFVAEAVEDPTTVPFKKANGDGAMSYYSKRPNMINLFGKAMRSVSVPFMREMLESYDGFNGIESLVDVGGNYGDCLEMIMQRYPNIRKGINFDLPHVVAHAPPLPGIIHVGGDAHEFVPNGDAIFLKWLVTTSTDEDTKKLFENCYKALPKGGKLIVVEPVLPESTDESQRTRTLLGADVYNMTMYNPKGKQRTEQQFKDLANFAGFSSCRAFYVDPFMSVLEFQK
ncbi:Nicotinate N-methyltransferase 1 [Stylosanthes scabra]|uniref:Nicotinate N-methyltransferase 1 n=1 Tax=Stylosanthes scabra TaxID=79078 RepID=A0ABU6WBD8_9FABA|nr:Nicotinate N-methyltransferase 1 [Stylosanthes scabra]